jgi:hypothetical protein
MRFSSEPTRVYKQIRAKVTSDQIPQYNEYGPVSDDFRDEKPFTPGSRAGESGGGDIASTRCVLDIPGGHLRDIKAAIAEDAVKCIYDDIDDALSKRPSSATASCTGTISVNG